MTTDDMVAEILASKKYKSIDTSVVRRICIEMEAKYPKRKDAIKAVKNELHIMHGSFLQNKCYHKAHVLLSQLTPNCDKTQLADIGMQIMQLHMSTVERLGDIHKIYDVLSQYVSEESTVMDIGCGFNPFAIPLLHELPKKYLAYDISIETIDLLNAYFRNMNQPQYKAALFDVAFATPEENVDVVFMFKLLPLLQQQKQNRGIAILEELHFNKAIISFPLQSLAGKYKGMEKFYSDLIENNLAVTLEIVEKHVFRTEMFYCIKKVKSKA